MIKEIDFPPETEINGKEQDAFYRDSFEFTVSKNTLTAKEVYYGIFGFLPKPIQWALALRNKIVKHLGFAASNTEMSLALEDMKADKKAGFLTIESVNDSEMICAAYEDNMDMWLSVLKITHNTFAVSTLVNLKTPSGKVYMAIIKPFHKLLAKYCIRQALKAGRI